MRIRSIVILLSLLSLGSAPALAQKVFIDYDKNYDGDSIKTFTWVFKDDQLPKGEIERHLHDHIVKTVQFYLTRDGAQEVETDPDVYVTYHTSTEEDIRINTRVYGYAYPIGWGFGGYYYGSPVMGMGLGVSSNHIVYEKGTLLVDIWDAELETMVWRGIAAKITVTEEASVLYKRIDKAVQKMVKEWRKIKRNQERIEATS